MNDVQTVGRYLRLQRFRVAFALAPRRDAAGFLAALGRPAFFGVRPTLVFLDVFLATLPDFAFLAALAGFFGALPVFLGVLPAFGRAAGPGLLCEAPGATPCDVL